MTSSSLSKNLLLATVDKGIQKALAMDSATSQKLARMQDFNLQVTIKGLDISLFVIVQQGEVTLASYHEGSIDCSLACYPTQLFSLFSLSAEGTPVLDSNVEVKGNKDILEELYEIFRRAEPDYEAELARWLGPVAGHQAGRTIRSGASWLRSSAESLAANLKLYIREEVELFPHPLEVAQFYEEIAELEQAASSLATKVEQLKSANTGGIEGDDQQHQAPGDVS